jgi:hypothetical protein
MSKDTPVDNRLDIKLREIVVDMPYPDTAVESIKQVIREEVGIDNIIQDLVNLRANMQHDLVRLGITSTPTKGTNQ